MNRRQLILGLATGAASPAWATTRMAVPGPDGLLRFPPDDAPAVVDFTRFVKTPVRLRAADVLLVGGRHQFLRVRSTDGHEGVVKANSRMEPVLSLLRLAVLEYFMGEDVRQLQALVQKAYVAEYKFAGLAFWTALGHLELAIWDMLGKAAGVRAVDMMGGPVRSRIPIYISSLSRGDVVRDLDQLAAEVEATGARGIKIKVGGRMSYNREASPGRDRAIVEGARKRFGDEFTLYADSNGSWDAPTAIGKLDLLEGNGVAILEEPCPFEDGEMTAQVVAEADRRGLTLRVAGGEQDGRMEQWRWYLANRGLHVLQPDFMYNGGMLRTLMVARMAAAAGVGVAPHYPRANAETVELIHFAAHVPNLHGLQEYRARPRTLDFPHAPRIEPRDGMLDLPPGPGFGIAYDPAMWADARPLG
jgi:L-alanine-DL-glutamate epimerase-like enolase superfamily enzyme